MSSSRRTKYTRNSEVTNTLFGSPLSVRALVDERWEQTTNGKHTHQTLIGDYSESGRQQNVMRAPLIIYIGFVAGWGSGGCCCARYEGKIDIVANLDEIHGSGRKNFKLFFHKSMRYRRFWSKKLDTYAEYELLSMDVVQASWKLVGMFTKVYRTNSPGERGASTGVVGVYKWDLFWIIVDPIHFSINLYAYYRVFVIVSQFGIAWRSGNGVGVHETTREK